MAEELRHKITKPKQQRKTTSKRKTKLINKVLKLRGDASKLNEIKEKRMNKTNVIPGNKYHLDNRKVKSFGNCEAANHGSCQENIQIQKLNCPVHPKCTIPNE